MLKDTKYWVGVVNRKLYAETLIIFFFAYFTVKCFWDDEKINKVNYKEKYEKKNTLGQWILTL